MKKILKIILIISVSISIISYGIYYLLVPEFKRNLIGNGMYIYVDNNKLFKNSYFIESGDDIQISLEKDEFTIYIPQRGCLEEKWEVSDFTDSGINIEKNFVKHCRVPIYDWNKDGNNYNMNVLKIRTEKGAKGKVVFKEKRYEENSIKTINNEIIVKLK